MARRVIPLGQPAPHEEPGGVVVDQRIGRAFVTVSDYASNSGLVRVFDTCTDALVRTIRVGAYAGAVAVDEQAGRVVVLHAPPPYYQGGRGRVTVLDAATEAVVRTVRVGTFPAALAVDARTHHVFVTAGHGAGSVRMLNALSGQLLRTVHVGLSPMAVAVDARTGRVFVAHHGEAGAVSLLDAATGAVLRTVHVGGTADAVIVDARAGRAFTTGDHDALRILSTASGAVVRTVTVPTAPGVVGATPAAVDTRAGFVFVLSKGPTSGGVIVGPGLVSVFDTRSGAPLGTAAAGRDNSAMALDDQRRRAFILDRSANTMIVLDYARLNVRAGAQRPSALCPPPQSITPTISLPHPGFALAVDTRTGRAFVKNGDGTLSVINTTDGRVLRTVQTDTRTRYPLGWLDPALAVDASRGHVFVANGGVVGSAAISGSVSMLDATSGVPLLTITAGRHPVAVALDRPRGRVFVANYGDGSVSILDAATGAVLRTVQVGGRQMPSPSMSGAGGCLSPTMASACSVCSMPRQEL